jgi:hypothetical protein
VGFLAILIIIAAKLASCSGDAAKIAEAIQEAEQMHDGYVQRALIRIKLKLEAEQKTASEVFISYRHESEEHKDWVRKLAEDLRQNGINALLDQWELHLGDSIGDFGATAIFRAKAMLCLITPASVAAVEADERTRSSQVRVSTRQRSPIPGWKLPNNRNSEKRGTPAEPSRGHSIPRLSAEGRVRSPTLALDQRFARGIRTTTFGTSESLTSLAGVHECLRLCDLCKELALVLTLHAPKVAFYTTRSRSPRYGASSWKAITNTTRFVTCARNWRLALNADQAKVVIHTSRKRSACYDASSWKA